MLTVMLDELAAGSPDLSGLWVDMMRSVPDGLMPEPPDAAGMQINRRAWLSGLGGLALGFAGGFAAWRLAAPRNAGWETAVTEYHALYAPATVAGLRPTAAAQQSELAAVRAASGLTVPLPPLAGISFRRAQMLALDGRPIVHIVLTTADVVPIAYCVTADAGAARSISYRQAAGMGLVTWADGAAAFLLVARLPEDQLLAMARALSA
jgi:hypothetical protein